VQAGEVEGVAMRIVYYDHGAADALQPGFRSGRADRVRFTSEGDLESEQPVRIPPNSLHALEGHGILARLNRLPLAIGPIAPGRDAVLRPKALDDASRIFYDADRDTYGARHEFLAHEARVPERVQYRIVIDNREYQRTLARLQYLVTLASREGFSLRLRL
jgi:hypothetical protein